MKTSERNALLLAGLVCAFSASVAQLPESSWEKELGITEGKLVKGSESPDGRFALFEFNFWVGKTRDSSTTATGIGLAPLDRTNLLYVIDSRTKWMTDKEVTSFLTFRWSKDSALLATHDAGARHSTVRVYQISSGRATQLVVPDLIDIACSKHGISRSSVTSSGQTPLKWATNNVLTVSVTINAKTMSLTSVIPVQVHDNGKISSQ